MNVKVNGSEAGEATKILRFFQVERKSIHFGSSTIRVQCFPKCDKRLRRTVMARLVSAIALGVAVADAWDAGEWFQQHGKDALETTQHCVSAASAVYSLEKTCGSVYDPKGWASVAVWGMLEILQSNHGPMAQQLLASDYVKAAKAESIRAVSNYTYEALEQFCNQTECFDGVRRMETEYAGCYAGTICMALGETLDFTKCKEAIEKAVPKSFNSKEQATCVKYCGEYCAQQGQRIMMMNPKCYATFLFPAIGNAIDCPQDCVDLWKKEMAEHTACMNILELQMKETWAQSRELAKDLMLAYKDPEMRKGAASIDAMFSMKTFADVCVNGTTDLEPLV